MWLTNRQNKEEISLLTLSLDIAAEVLAISIETFILQKRELERFWQQQEAEEKEQKAKMKEQQVTTVLNSQSDAIIVFNTGPAHFNNKNN